MKVDILKEMAIGKPDLMVPQHLSPHHFVCGLWFDQLCAGPDLCGLWIRARNRPITDKIFDLVVEMRVIERDKIPTYF